MEDNLPYRATTFIENYSIMEGNIYTMLRRLLRIIQ